MTENLEPQKPTWFELIDGDAPSAQVTKVNKKLPIIAALVAGAVIASGALLANASDRENIVGTSGSTSMSQVDNTTSATSNPSGITNEVSNSQPAAPNTTGAVVATANNKIQDPTLGGMKAPGGRDHDDDDDDDEDDDDDHEDRERNGHERGEGRERGEH